ncbi:MAG: PEP/pyruvate-binding domain-containing protein [Candidatus Nanohaloarchaea archaeon]|nr:PEP/pyruvate-binding domain-containing protein [Candidatus Nanohaloarchaea archaeon]
MGLEWLDDIDDGEEREYGLKASSLAAARDAGLEVPKGFVVTAGTFESFVRENGMEERIQRILNDLDRSDLSSVRRASRRIRSMITDADVPDEVREEIEEAYEKINMSEEVRNAAEEAVDLVGGQRETEFVAVRSSATGDRIPGAFHTELNVNGKDAVVEGVKRAWASLYSPEALSVEDEVGEIHSMAVLVQRMVEPEVSGSAFDRDPVSGSGRLVEAVWGLGTSLSGGSTTPDKYVLDEHGDVESEEIANKGWKIVRDPTSGKNLKQRVPGDERESRTLESSDLRKVVEALRKAERSFSGDLKIDFALARNGVQVLDLQRMSSPSGSKTREREGLVRGRGASPGDGSGPVSIIYTDTDVEEVGGGEVLAVVEADERFTPVLRSIEGMVADEGGVSSNLAAVSREVGVPLVVGAKNATDMLSKGEEVTLSGDTGIVWEGSGGERGENSVEEASNGGSPDLLTATRVKALNSTSPDAEGVVVPEYVNPGKAERVAERFHPEKVWIRTEERRGIPNLGVLADVDGPLEGRGTVLDTYGNVMRTSNLLEEGVSFLGIDADELKKDGGREALMNAIEKLGEEAEGCETAILMQDLEPEYIQRAVESGVDTVAVPAESVGEARRKVAEAERRFMMDRLREL